MQIELNREANRRREEQEINSGQRGQCPIYSLAELGHVFMPKLDKLHDDVCNEIEHQLWITKATNFMWYAGIRCEVAIKPDEIEAPTKNELLILTGQLQRHTTNKELPPLRREQLILAAEFLRKYLYATHLELDKNGRRVKSD